MSIIFAIVIGYILGSIPFGLIFVKLAGLGDIRDIGSGNIGMTNVLRTGRKDLAALTFICDAIKAAIAYFLFLYISEIAALIAGFMAIVGHNYSVFLKFKGGKGVATTIGLYFVIHPFAALMTIFTWVVIVFITHISSLSSMIALIVGAVTLFFLKETYLFGLVAIILSLLCIWRHKENILRIIQGKENTINLFSKKKGNE